MIVAIFKMNVPPDNRKEFIQTVKSLVDCTRGEKGCISHNVYQDIENENRLVFVEEWQSGAALKDHIRSDWFSVLMGAMQLLEEPPEIKFNTISHTTGIETVQAVRS